MKFLLIIFLISLFILLIPVKLTLNFSYINSTVSLKVYHFKILPKDKSKKLKKQKKNFFKKKKRKKKKPSKLSNLIKDTISPSFIMLLISDLNRRRYKPKLKFDSILEYSLNDAKNTALAYGGVSMVFPVFYNILSVVFKIKDSKFKLNPLFRDKFLVNFKITCIFKISLGQIMYALFIIIKSFYKKRRCSH